MRHISMALGSQLLMVPLAFAGRESPLHLNMRMGEFRAVIVAPVRATRVITVDGAAGATFVAVAELEAEEILKGAGIERGARVDVALARPTRARELAQLQLTELGNQRRIWFLEPGEQALGGVPYLARIWNEPNPIGAWDAYLDSFRANSPKWNGWEKLTLELSVPDSIPAGGSWSAALQLANSRADEVVLASQIRWQGHVAFILEPATDGYLRNTAPELAQPFVEVLAASGSENDAIPVQLDHGTMLHANATAVCRDLRVKAAESKFYVCARILDDHGQVLIQSAPRVVTIEAAAPQQGEPKGQGR